MKLSESAAYLVKIKETAAAMKLRHVTAIEIKPQTVYSGYIDQNGCPSLQGTLVWPDGTKYEGEWLDGQANGKGKL